MLVLSRMNMNKKLEFMHHIGFKINYKRAYMYINHSNIIWLINIILVIIIT